MTGTLSAQPNAEQSAALRRIAAFRQRFGEGHFYLACHAALPLALTPDLLYCLWVNFQQDSQLELLDIPWIAVSDLILSNLCEEVGCELYEMDSSTRNELLKQLQNDSRFGLDRIRELADFVMAYVEQELDHSDLDTRDFAQIQKLRALAYKQPSEAAHEIASILTQLNLKDTTEWIRMAELSNGLIEPLSAFQPLLNYIRAMANLARGNLEAASAQMTKAIDANNQVRIGEINLPIPGMINEKLPKRNEQNILPVLLPSKFKLSPSARDRFELSLPYIVVALTALTPIVLAAYHYLRSPSPQRTPDITSQQKPSTSPSSSPSPFPALPSVNQEVKTLQALKEIQASRPGEPLSVSPDSRYIASGGRDGVLRLWGADGLLLKAIKGHTDRINSVAFSPDGKVIASGSDDKTIRLWDTKTVITSGSDDKTIRLWDTKTGQLIGSPLIGHTNRINSVAFSPDGQLIASGSSDKTARLWNAKIGQPIATLFQPGLIYSVSFSPDGKILATASEDQTVKLWSSPDGKLLSTFKWDYGAVTGVSFSPDGKTITTTGRGKNVGKWSLDGRLLEVTSK